MPLQTSFIKKGKSNENGSLSVSFVFFIIIALTTLGVVSYSVMTMDSRMSVKQLQVTQSRYWAEAGIEYAIKKLIEDGSAPSSESFSSDDGNFSITSTTSGSETEIISTGAVANSEKTVKVTIQYQPPIGDFAIYATGEVSNVTALNEMGDPDPSLMVMNAASLPDLDDQALIDMATAQGHVETGSEFSPSHGYPNFNFYYSGTTPNVTHVHGDLRVQGGRTVYGIFVVDGDIRLDGSSRVYGVLYMRFSNNIVIHGGGTPTESSVTGGVVANGDVDGTGNHITVHYNPEYMSIFGDYENGQNAILSIVWEEL